MGNGIRCWLVVNVLFVLITMQGLNNPVEVGDRIYYNDVRVCTYVAEKLSSQHAHHNNTIYAYCIPVADK